MSEKINLETIINLYNLSAEILVNKVIDANEKIGKLSQRFGRIISRMNEIDHTQTGLFPLIQEYRTVMDGIEEAYARFNKYLEELGNYASTHEKVNFSSLQTAPILNTVLPRFYAKKEVINDILYGMLEKGFDQSMFEESQRKKIEAEMKKIVKSSTIEHPYVR